MNAERALQVLLEELEHVTYGGADPGAGTEDAGFR